jgi:hypothetical protein
MLRLQADLTFSSTPADGSEQVTGRVTADGSTIDVSVTGPLASLGRPSSRLVRQFADSLAARGLRLVLHGPQGMIMAIGDVDTLWWQRLLTRSPHIRVGSPRRLRSVVGASSSRSRSRGSGLSVPPPTLFPLFPTVSTLGPRQVTTTHDPRGGGRPRLYFGLSAFPQVGEVQRVEYLTQQRTTIGSAPECDIHVDGLQPIHAVIERTAEDEYVLTHVATAGTSTVAGIPAQGSRLRTGAGILLDGTRLSYVRDEFADHGRPYGGRLGGEIGRQRPQRKPRPSSPGVVGRPRTNRDEGRYYS